jgi:WD40 repeat protein
MECPKCHFNYKEEDTKKFTCGHIICKTCFYNVIIKDLINSINNSTKTYSINCKFNEGNISFNYDELRNIVLPQHLEEIKSCSIHNNEIFQFYDKTNKKLLCNKCNENPDFQTHEKIKIDDLKASVKNKTSEIKYKSYEEFQKYIKTFFEKFVENSQKYYQEEISKMEMLIQKIKEMEKDLKTQLEEQIEKEKMLFNLIDVLYKKNYENLNMLNNESDTETKYGYRFYKLLSKVKFDFGEFGIEHQEEIITEFDKMIKDFEENISKKRFKTSIKYPYFELIKSFSKITDIKQDAIISCIASNKKTNELSVGFRDYSINIFRPQGSNYESFQKIKNHKGEITSLLYVDNYLVSGSKDKTLKVWEQDINNNNTYILKQIIRSFEREIKKLNIYNNDLRIGFLVSSEESSFRLFLKILDKEKENENEKDLNSMELEENEKKESEKAPTGEDENKNLEEIFKIKQVLNEHDNEVCEAIQIKANNDIISGSKDMTLVVWKDIMNCLGYESDQIISAGNEVQAICPFGNKGFAFAINGSYELKIYEFNNEEGQYENICVLAEDFCHGRPINEIILLRDNRLASCSYDSLVKIISFNSLTKELREDQELEEQDLSVNSIAETGNGKLISGGHSKQLIIYKRA